MPRRPRIESIGFHHIINRGVARGDIFLKEEDYKAFLDILHVSKSRYDFVVHSFCLMSNHYHLLIETSHENLSLLARQINSQYAQYFNREYERVGPLWQGRFKNWFVYDEAYLFSLFKYIEYNPVKAKLVDDVGSYPWNSLHCILNGSYSSLLEGSQLAEFARLDLFDTELSDDDLEQLNTFHKTVYKNSDDKVVRLKQHSLKEHFDDVSTIALRNAKIVKAFSDGYTQGEIARYFSMTNANVSKIISAFNRKLGAGNK